jgi:hypothetical protein
MRPLVGVVLAVVALNPGAPALGQTSGGWVGTKIVTKTQTPLRVNDQVVDDNNVHRIFTVKAVNGPWLWVVSSGVAGWVRADQVVRFDQAIDYFTGLLRVDPGRASAYLNRALIRIDKGDHDLAIDDLSEAIRLDPGLSVAHYSRGFIWDCKKEYEKAYGDYTVAILLDPKSASAWNNRAWLMATCPDSTIRNAERAVADATRACELTEWRKRYFLGTLAAACNEVGDLDAAVRHQEKALGLYADEEGRQKRQDLLAKYEAKRSSGFSAGPNPLSDEVALRPSSDGPVPSPSHEGKQSPPTQTLNEVVAPISREAQGSATAPAERIVLLVLLPLLVLEFFLLLHFAKKSDLRRSAKQAGGVSDQEHVPVSAQSGLKETPSKPTSVEPAPSKGTTPEVAKIDIHTMTGNPTVENPSGARRLNPMGLTGFILGLCSMVLYAIGILPILAIVFSGIGMRTFKPDTQKSPWMAYIGLGLGIVYTIMDLSGNGHLR